jgi:hypothetical protein
MFPELNECCRCCTTDKGCGIRPYSWLDHASYIDREVKNGRQTIKWVNKGIKPTYYWSTDDDQRIPVELDEGGFPYNYQAFDVDSFSTASWVSDAELFAVPEDCVQRKCPLKSLCSLA